MSTSTNGTHKFNPQQVHQLLIDGASANDQQRRPAEQQIEQFLLLSNHQIDAFLVILCQLLSHPQQTQTPVRARIAILIRTRIAMKLHTESKKSIFCHLHGDTQQQLLRVLLSSLSSDPEREVRNQIADCLTELSTRTLAECSKQYESVHFMKRLFELYNLSDTQPPSTTTTPSDNNEANESEITNRINALQIFGHLCAWCSSQAMLKQNQASILQLYRVAFAKDANRRVNIAALEAIQLTMKPLKRADIAGFVPLMLDVLSMLEATINTEGQRISAKLQENADYPVSDDDYEHTQCILEILIQIVCDQPAVFDDHPNQQKQSPLMAYCTAFTQLAATIQLPPKVRTLALEFFLSLAENDPSLARRKPVIAQSVIDICTDHLLLSQMDDAKWAALPYEEDEDHNNLFAAGEYGLDRLVSALTAKHSLPPIYRKLGIFHDTQVQRRGDEQYWKNSDWRRRHCAVTVITQISDHMAVDSKEVELATSKCIELMSDSNARIQYAAINAIGQLCNDHCELLMSEKYKDVILKQLLQCLSLRKHIKIQTHACAALINFVCNLESSQIKAPLADLLNAVMTVLQNANTEWSKCSTPDDKKNYKKAQEQSLTAIAGLAEAAGAHFHSYYDVFAPILMSIVKTADRKQSE